MEKLFVLCSTALLMSIPTYSKAIPIKKVQISKEIWVSRLIPEDLPSSPVPLSSLLEFIHDDHRPIIRDYNEHNQNVHVPFASVPTSILEYSPKVSNYLISGLPVPGPATQFTSGLPVPEPTTMALFGSGLIGLAAVHRRKKK